jgi:hypothetical protein
MRELSASFTRASNHGWLRSLRRMSASSGNSHRFGYPDPIDAGREDAAGVAGAFAGRIQAPTFTLWQSSPRVMRSGDEVRVSTPVRTASGIAKP